MATITITAANVIAPSGSTYVDGKLAGESLSAGDWVYLKASDGKVWKANPLTSAAAAVIGMAANTAATGQPIKVISKATACAVGSVVESGAPYFLSSDVGASGKMFTVTNQSGSTNSYPKLVCQAVSASTITFDHTDPVAPALWTN